MTVGSYASRHSMFGKFKFGQVVCFLHALSISFRSFISCWKLKRISEVPVLVENLWLLTTCPSPLPIYHVMLFVLDSMYDSLFNRKLRVK